ncbi:MAG: LPS assembly lipoprotein LptE [Gemmatimonadota bacterium]
MRFRARASGAAGWMLVTACNYTFAGGGGLPSRIHTVSIPPVENETTRFVLTERFTQGLLDAARGRLGVKLAPETTADAIIRATITRYDDRALNFQAQEDVGAEVFQRRVTISARVELYDATRKEILWSAPVSGVGEYAPDTETEDVGQELALENLIQKVVDGAQSQW